LNEGAVIKSQGLERGQSISVEELLHKMTMSISRPLWSSHLLYFVALCRLTQNNHDGRQLLAISEQQQTSSL
jgi:exopolyphosphatase/pppGpp-phosphohydrolase